jgi:hypothetical protein
MVHEGPRPTFTFTDESDTVAPVVLFSGIRDSSQDVPRDVRLMMELSEPVLQEGLAGGVVVRDSTGRRVPCAVSRWGGKDIMLAPGRNLEPLAWYAVSIIADSVVDLAGNRMKDSLLVLRFRTLDPRRTGAAEGWVNVASGVPFEGRVVVAARRVEAVEPFATSVTTRVPGAFLFDGLPEGRYTFDAFHDVDSSGRYRYGRPYPFLPAARYALSPDTVRVRARWRVENVRVSFQ